LFLRELGYTNLGGGARAVDALLQEGYVERTLLQRWSASRYAPPSERIADALAATHAQVRAEQDAKEEAYRDTQRAKFKPFFQPVPELTRPSSITAFAITGGHTKHTHLLPEGFATWTAEEQAACLARVTRSAARPGTARRTSWGARSATSCGAPTTAPPCR
jgi:hypothetical protein